MADAVNDSETERHRANAYRAASDWSREHPPGTPVLAWPGARKIDGYPVEPLRTRTRGSAWVIGVDDVVVRVDGHAGGIAITHVDHDPTRQPAVPDVEFSMPPCPICDTALDSDGDALVCYPCGASWSSDGTGGEWQSPDRPRCRATARPYATIKSDDVLTCVLHLGHDLEGEEYSETHRPAYWSTEWTDRDPRAITDTEGEPLRFPVPGTPA